MGRPLDDMPDRAIVRRAAAARGEVVDPIPAEEAEPDDGPSADDLERFSGVTVRCRGCGAELHDDVDLCWRCGRAVGADGRPFPLWVVAAAVLALLAMLALVLL